ncbi:MAG: AraC family transcriptional regulator ligand-binding domain-containing protein [Pannonibacter sp.]
MLEHTRGTRRLQDDWCRADTLQALEIACKLKRLDWAAIARHYGVRADQPHCPAATVDYRTAIMMFEHVAQACNDDGFMLDVASSLPLGLFSTFDYVGMCAPSLATGLMNWSRFLPLRTNFYRLTFTEEAEYGILEWHVPDCGLPRIQSTYERVAWAVGRIEFAIQDPTASLIIEISQPAPRRTSDFQRRHGSRLLFGRQHDRIYIPKHYLALPTPRSEANLYAIVEQAAIREMEEYGGRNEPLTRVAERINDALKSGTVSLEHIAADLGMSQRSLQRLLEAEGTSFRKLTETIRRNMAARYLKDTSLPMKEIAFLLGFSELSAFSRAVKAWYGVPPKTVRLTGSPGTGEPLKRTSA